MVKVLDCSLKEIDFELQSDNYIHFWTNALEKGINPFILPAIVPMLFFYKDDISSK